MMLHSVWEGVQLGKGESLESSDYDRDYISTIIAGMHSPTLPQAPES